LVKCILLHIDNHQLVVVVLVTNIRVYIFFETTWWWLQVWPKCVSDYHYVL